MRIAMFHPTLPRPERKPGGVEVFVDRLANALVLRGHEVEVLSYSPAPPSARYEVRRLRPYASEQRRFLRQYGSSWLLNLRSFEGFDVAHFHGDDWFFLRRPLPVVRTFHGSALLEALNATSWKRRLDKAVIFPLELLAAALATGRYAVGTDSEIIYRAEGLLNLGIDPPQAPARPSPHPTILFIGTWGGRKRGSFLQEVFQRQVRPAVPGAELWMVSDACEPAEGVRWIRNPSDGELQGLFAQAWAFCLPSSYEGFGLPYLEAMAHGIPTVGTPNAGSRLLLADGAGILAEDEDLGSRLVDLLTQPRLRAALAEGGRKRADEYSWERMAERHERAYAKAIDRWRSLKGGGRPA
jgi:phosphatidyl-myo-inositol alpha-mannosyltransferase